MSNLFVVDDDFEFAAGTVKYYGVQLDAVLQRYINILKTAKQKAVVQGETAENLETLIGNLSALEGDLTEVTKSIEAKCIQYISDIDYADDFIY